MKKFLSLILILPLAFLFCACGKGENTVSDNGSSKQTESTASTPTENATSSKAKPTVTRKNIKINFLGDSITAGNGVSDKNNRFVNRIGSKVDIVHNYGISGTSIAYQQNSSTPDRYFCNRYHEMNTNADYIVILGGTNDYGFGDAPLGTIEDTSPETFYGALNYLYSVILNNYPESQIIVVTPPRLVGDDNLQGYNGYKGKDVASLETYVNIIKEVADCYSLPIIDLFSVPELNPNNAEFKKTYFADNVHPNDAGHQLIADKIWEYITSVEK